MSLDVADITISSPSNISSWVQYRLHNPTSTEESLWKLRWICVQNGIFFWYLNDSVGAPEGFLVLCNCSVAFRDGLSSEVILSLETEGLFHEIRLGKSVELFWKEVISQNVKVARSPMSAEEFLMEDIDAIPQASMQIHLKGVPHVISISATDNATAIAEAFVVEHKLKTDITSRIELELLRTQVDSCLSQQTKLRQQVSRLRRLCIDASMYETRALAAESSNFDLHALATRIQKTILPCVQERVLSLEKEREENREEIIRLDALLQAANKTATDSRKNERIAQKKFEVALDHCHQVQDKLKAAAALHKRLAASIARSEAEQTASSRLIFASSNGRSPSPPSPARSEISLQLDPVKEREIQNAVYEATEQLTHSYEQKLLSYESKVREQGRALEAVEKAQSVDKRAMTALQREVESLKEENNRLQELNASAEREQGGSRSHFEDLVAALNRKIVQLEESNSSLQTKHTFLQGRYDSLQKLSNDREDENKRIMDKLRQLSALNSSDLVRNLTDENRALSEQATRLRAEVIRLNEEMANIQAKALQAVQAVQVMGRDSSLSSLSRGPLTYRSSSDSVAPADRGSQQRSLRRCEDGSNVSNGSIDAGEMATRSPREEDEAASEEVIVELEVEIDEDDAQAEDSDKLLGETSEYEAGEEVDLSGPLSALEAKSREKIANMLSPVVEDRLLRNIYHRYALETSGLLNLSRFGRFTKEFGITGSMAGRKDKSTTPMLTYGDVDVIFTTTLKRVAPEEVDVPMNMVDLSISSAGTSNARGHQAAFVPAGAVQHSMSSSPSTPSTKGPPGSLSQMTANQFIAAVKELAVKLYGHLIVENFGTVVDCLPPKQRERAVRGVMDVMIAKKIALAADKLGLIPTDLMTLDQTLTAIQAHPFTAQSLSSHIDTVSSWFLHYAKVVQIIAPTEPESRGSPRSPMLYGAMSSALSLSTGGEGAVGYSSKKPPRAAPPPPVNIKGVTYKAVSRFFQDYGIVPYLIKEPQLHSLFQEIMSWAKGNIDLLLTALPEDVRGLPQVQSEMHSSAMIRAKLACKNVVGLGCFFVLFAAVATQVFGDIDMEKRVSRLFQWAAQSGGSYLMRQKRQENGTHSLQS